MADRGYAMTIRARSGRWSLPKFELPKFGQANFERQTFVDMSKAATLKWAAFLQFARSLVEEGEIRSRALQAFEAAKEFLLAGKKQIEQLGDPGSEIKTLLVSCRHAFWGILVFSGLSNILMLTGSFFLLQVYDRVLPSRSVPTLVALMVLAATLYIVQGALDLIRNRIGVRIGRHLDETLCARVFDLLVRLPLKTRGGGDGVQPLRDLDNLRSFLSSGGPSVLFDLPWMPLYVGICFIFHFWIGMTALAGVIVLIALTIFTELRTKSLAQAASALAVSRYSLAAEGRRNAEVLQAMGMRQEATERWRLINIKYLSAHERASDVASFLGGMSKVFRFILQSGVLAVGAYLVIHQQATAGIIIASSILTSRALAPVELAIANWRGMIAARQSARRLDQLLLLMPADDAPLALPEPSQSLVVDRLCVAAPGSRTPLVEDASFELKRGQALGIIGPSGSGKSSLARALVGVWPRLSGNITLDNASLEHWPSDMLGRQLGYLPQDVELFDGSIALNIARFDPRAKAADVLEAANAAGVHDLILGFPDAYSTRIGEGGMSLSAGQRQRIGLARALYGNPFLLVLDEPSSNLDSQGEEALTEAILNVRRRGGIAIIVAHRPKALDGVDHVLVLSEGRVQSFGPRDDVLKKTLHNPTPLRIVDGNRRMRWVQN